jgi:hypothetical protein
LVRFGFTGNSGLLGTRADRMTEAKPDLAGLAFEIHSKRLLFPLTLPLSSKGGEGILGNNQQDINSWVRFGPRGERRIKGKNFWLAL